MVASDIVLLALPERQHRPLSHMLKRSGYGVHVATTVTDAVELIPALKGARAPLMVLAAATADGAQTSWLLREIERAGRPAVAARLESTRNAPGTWISDPSNVFATISLPALPGEILQSVAHVLGNCYSKEGGSSCLDA